MFDQLLENTILLFVSVDPIALIPIFASLTQGLHKDDIKKIYIQATIVSFFVLSLFYIFGTAILDLMGISMSSFKIIGGLFLMESSSLIGETLFQLGLLGFATGTLFSFVTLPVEFDASNRAIYWLERKRIVNQRELISSKDALKWAAMTYVVAALGSLAQLVYFILRSRR